MILKQTRRTFFVDSNKAQYQDRCFFVNDLPNFSVLDPIMFIDDTNLFFEQTDLIILFYIINEELNKIYEWLNANKLSLSLIWVRFLEVRFEVEG